MNIKSKKPQRTAKARADSLQRLVSRPEFHVKSTEWALMPEKTKLALAEMVETAARQFRITDKHRLDWMEANKVAINRLSESHEDARQKWHLYYDEGTKHVGKLGQSLRDVIDEAIAANADVSDRRDNPKR